MSDHFPRYLHLIQLKDFRRVFRSPRKIRNKHFTTWAQDNKLDHARLGIVTSKRNIPKAVDRNRLKRIIRESFRVNKGLGAGLDIVLSVYRSANDLTSQEFRECINKQWEQLTRD